MHEGCSSMVSIPKAHLALTRVERAGLPVITIITDPTLGGVAIGYASRGIRLFEYNAGNIGFSGKRVIEQYIGKKTSSDFKQAAWLKKQGHKSRKIIQPLLNALTELKIDETTTPFPKRIFADRLHSKINSEFTFNDRVLSANSND